MNKEYTYYKYIGKGTDQTLLYRAPIGEEFPLEFYDSDVPHQGWYPSGRVLNNSMDPFKEIAKEEAFLELL